MRTPESTFITPFGQTCNVAFMFSRATGLPFTCLRCQTRLARWKGFDNTPSVPLLLPSRLRWQSAVAVRVEDQEHDTQSSTSQDVHEPHHGRENPTAASADVAQANKKGSRDRTKVRRWRPHNAEGLGVSVLGKPAEIIILPSKKKPQAASPTPESEEQNHGKVGVQQSLDSESKPVALKDVLKNIDSIKSDFGQGKQKFTTSEWGSIKTHLAHGFTKSQLLEYLRVTTGTVDSTYNNKRSLAAAIMSKAWKWKNCDTQEIQPDGDPNILKKSVIMDITKLNYIMAYENQRLDQLSADLGVQISVWKRNSRIKVSGSATALKTACDELKSLKQKIRIHTLQVPEQLKSFLVDNTQSDGLLRTLMQKHKLYIHRVEDILKITSTNETASDLVLRGLILASNVSGEAAAYSTFCEPTNAQLIQAPIYPNGLPQWTQTAFGWYRYISAQALDVADEDATVNNRILALRNLARDLLKAEKPSGKRLSLFKIAPGSIRQDFSLELGQMLFREKTIDTQTQTLLVEEQALADSRLILQQAMLPQLLAKDDFVIWPDTDEIRTEENVASTYPLLIRLRLRPVTRSDTSPLFEIYLSGLDTSLGFRQQLSIRKINALIDQWQHTILLPQKTFDISLNRQSNINLFVGDGSEPPKPYLDILRQLSSHLEQAKPSTQFELPLIWKLDLSSLIVNESIAQTRKRKTPVQVKYVLEPPELLNVTTYTSTFTGDNFIDHVSSNTEYMDKPYQKQSLRISSDTLSNLLRDGPDKATKPKQDITQNKTAFANTVGSAYQFATRLSDAARSAGWVGIAADDATDV